MDQTIRSRILYALLIFYIAAFPLSISTQFFSINDLVKSSVLFLVGGIIIFYFFILLTYEVLTGAKGKLIFYHSGILDLCVLLLLLATVLSTVFSLRPYTSFWGTYERHVGLITYIYLTILYFISGSVFSDFERRKTALQMIEIISVIISIYAILQFLNYDLFNLQPGWFERPGSFLGFCVFLGGFLALSFPFSVLNTAGKKNKILKLLFPFIIILAIIVSGTRSAYIAVLIQFVVLVLFNKKLIMVLTPGKKTLVFIISTAAVFLVFLFLFIFKEGMLYQRIITAIDFDNPRLILWKDASKVFYKFPLIGPGIAMFPAALEEFYSNALRFREANVIFDHAHNNYLHILFTLGLTGLMAYILLIYSSFYTGIRSMKSKAASKENRNISLAVILMLAGYCAYGFTNFDDISILFLLFIFLSILRSLAIKKTEVNFRGFKLSAAVISIAIVVLSAVNIPHTINKLRADRYYKLAYFAYNKGEFKEALRLNNEAIDLNPDCSAYRYYEAVQVYIYCFDNDGLSKEAKQNLLKQVKAEINKAKENLYYINLCNGMLSLVYYEEGRVEEAEKLKNEVLEKDSINVNYRIKLTRYLLKENRLEEAKRNLNVILLIKPFEPASKLLAAVYYSKAGDKQNAIKYSNEILLVEPDNKIALDIIKGYDEKK